ncbi:MAG: pyridoxal-phosphate dependent enzyme [Planctomycetota bacterium]
MSEPRFPSILDHVGRTPLVELRRIGAELPVPLLAKCEHLNPGGSVKPWMQGWGEGEVTGRPTGQGTR